MKRAATAVAVWVASLAGACVGPSYTIVDDPFDIAETTTAPEISAVVDVGGGDVTLLGPLAMEASDGVAVIGETLWVRGSSFGKQPTVLVGGRPAAVLGPLHQHAWQRWEDVADVLTAAADDEIE